MNDQYQNYQSGEKRAFDLEERVSQFAEKVVRLCRKLVVNSVNKRIIEQLVGAAASIGCNYMEATEAESRRDFGHKMGIAKKEIKECRYLLRVLATANPEIKDELRNLWREANELLLIFSQSIKTSKIAR